MRRDDPHRAGRGRRLAGGHGRRLTGANQGQLGLGHLGVQLQPTVSHHAEQLCPGGDDLALGHAAAGDQTGDGRADGGLAEAGLGFRQGGAGGRQIGAGAALIGQGRVQRRLAEEAPLLQLLGARQGRVVAGDIGLGQLHLGLLLAQLGAQQDVVHLHQGLALTDIGAFVHIDGDSRQAARLGRHRHFLPG